MSQLDKSELIVKIKELEGDLFELQLDYKRTKTQLEHYKTIVLDIKTSCSDIIKDVIDNNRFTENKKEINQEIIFLKNYIDDYLKNNKLYL